MPARRPRPERHGPVVVFDLGGVVIHWSDLWASRAIARRFHLPQLATHRTLSAASAEVELGRSSIAQFGRRVAARLPRANAAEVGRVWIGTFVRRARPNVRVVTWAADLRTRGIEVACLSNTTRAHVRRLEAGAALRPFSPRLYSFELRARKPSRLAFEAARRRLARPAGQLFLIDDRLENVRAARRAGWAAHRFRDIRRARAALERWLVSRRRRRETF
ncbi:MAG: HAD family hydrolase [Thermoplasmata archaeon]